jgi:hypothetical protein
MKPEPNAALEFIAYAAGLVLVFIAGCIAVYHLTVLLW